MREIYSDHHCFTRLIRLSAKFHQSSWAEVWKIITSWQLEYTFNDFCLLPLSC